MKPHFACIATGLAGIALLSTALHAEVLFYDGFGYARKPYDSAAPLPDTWTGDFEIVDACLLYESEGLLDTQGNTMLVHPACSAVRTLSMRGLADAAGVDSGASFCMSFMLQFDKPPGTNSTLLVVRRCDGTPMLEFGAEPDGFWCRAGTALSNGDGNATGLAGTPVQSGIDHEMVDFSQHDVHFVTMLCEPSAKPGPRAIVLVDPPLNREPMTLTMSVPSDTGSRSPFYPAALELNGATDTPVLFDEIRIGENPVEVGFKPASATLPSWLAGVRRGTRAETAAPREPEEPRPPPPSTAGKPVDAGTGSGSDFTIGDQIVANVIVIKGNEGSGTGVVVSDGSNTYLYSNLHIVSGNKGVKLLDNTGKSYSVRGFECASDRDLVRLILADPPTRGLPLTNTVPVGTRVAVCGNAEGEDVMRPVYGEVLGIGPQKVETSAEFVQGHSGSPIVTRDGHVVGIATYVTRANTNWVNKDTPFTVTRRFGCRVANVPEWVPVSMRWFTQESNILQERETAIRDVFAVLSVWADDPVLGILPLDDTLPVELQGWMRDHNAWVRRNRERNIGQHQLSQAMHRDMQIDYDRLHSTVKSMLDIKEPHWHLEQFDEQWDDLDDFEHFLWVIMDHVQEYFRTR